MPREVAMGKKAKGPRQKSGEGVHAGELGSSISRSRSMQWLLGDGMSTAEFFETHWEKKPLVVKRGSAGYYGQLFDRERLLGVLKAQKIDFGAGITIAKHDPSSAGKVLSREIVIFRVQDLGSSMREFA